MPIHHHQRENPPRPSQGNQPADAMGAVLLGGGRGLQAFSFLDSYKALENTLHRLALRHYRRCAPRVESVDEHSREVTPGRRLAERALIGFRLVVRIGS